MANICRTKIIIKSTPSAVSDFATRFDNCDDGKYPPDPGISHIVDEFGWDAELFIDRVGSKWVTKYDGGISYYGGESDDEVTLNLESAWYSPSDMIKEIYRQFTLIYPETRIYGEYWDEGYAPIGVFELYNGIIIEEEQVVENEETEMEYFWGDVIEPTFESLRKKLDETLKYI